ncbi:NRAMP (natural resistance-associated macrophage protein)-like metal ion transporter [Paraburkholderia unamae]|uniref:NRAMP family divalent metal transporter n=1 Tax=Paraburkholderia unamae TaxID=219649 RepID=UPI000DC2F622|nr:divalent metal cation transporter [Paraburkholderia unamae]RAR54626.1 NRAMP (natural resistance-associated macrophage protein)-like metal ion transporter [Paraburkholderia unamae]
MTENEGLEPEAAVVDRTERSWLSRLGPGLVTGAADDDPSGIGTYSQAGAKFGFSLLWTLLLTYPLMVAIQMTSARIGRVTGKGLASNIRAFGSTWIVVSLVLLLATANTINIAADLAAMGAALHLLVPGPTQLYVILIGAFSATLQIWLPYDSYARFLKWLTLVLFAYIAVAFVVPVDWRQVAVSIVRPKAALTNDYLSMVVAVLGTTISPYLFFWQASQEVEELRSKPGERPLRWVSSFRAYRHLDRITADTWIGMAVSNGVGFFIMLTAAATLHVHGIEIQTSADAAKALAPIAGHLAALVFAAAIVGTGLLALPVLAGSAAYGAAGAFRWRSSLSLHLTLAREFYSVILVAIVGGVAITFFPLDPVKALYWSAIINGLAAVPVMVVVMLMASSQRVMGKFVITGMLRAGGWLATALMAVAAVGMFL